MRYLKYLLMLLFVSGYAFTYAHIGPNEPGKANKPKKATYRADCAQATAQTDQEINNIRARLLTGGDVWWDGDDGRYIVPKVEPGSGIPERSSLFSGAVWLGGIDPGGNLKIAAQTYGSASGQTDFWPGPLTDIGTVEVDTCKDWDRFFKVLGSEIDVHLSNYAKAVKEGVDYDPDLIPKGVKSWPARGNEFFFEAEGFELPNTIQGLAAFWDADGDGDYEPDEGDYPRIEIRGCDEPQYPDEMIFWIYNDAGGIHTESNGDAIQMEVQVQTFAYATNDEINDMTFQRYKLINRAIESIDSMFFAMWVDPDLGCYTDDYVGCDTSRSLAYVYNEDALDGESSCNDCPQGVNTYCTDIPILGVDYFRGPLDENGNEIGMSSFTYYNNGSLGPPPGTEDPATAQEYYNYLSGSWKDGTRFTYGGNGYNLGSIELINYAFTEPPNDPNGWSMCTEALPFGDRRTVQASGPFRLDPGAVNELIIGVVWIPEVEYPCPDITALTFADDIAQALFDNCFDITDGPDAPDVDWIELDQEVIAVLTNDEDTVISNNAFEQYEELDLRAPDSYPEDERKYKFEGYKLFQLRDASVSAGELDNPEKARLIYQVDLANGVSEIFNWSAVDNPSTDPDAPNAIWVPESQVEGADAGIRHTFRITRDQFDENSGKLLNHKKYYFTAIAYAYNQYEEFSQQNGVISGQRTPYLEGRRNIRTYTVIPRPIVNQKLHTFYGDGPIITRLDGIGNGNNFLDVSKAEREKMFEGTTGGEITYLPAEGPISINIYNPLGVVDGEYELTFIDEDMDNDELDDDVRWRLTNLGTNEVVESETNISRLNEQIIAQFGFSIGILQADEPGSLSTDDNGAIGVEVEYDDLSKPLWFGAVPDQDPNPQIPLDFVKTDPRDPKASLSTMGDGFFVPYTLTDFRTSAGPFITPCWVNSTSDIVRVRNPLSKLNNVDIVFTSDKSKWSRCVIVESATRFYYDQNLGLGIPTEGGAEQFDPREAPSVGKEDADGDGLPDEDGDGTGMGWFPGYAVDVETGERLNIFFGENSTYNGVLFGDQYDTPDIAGKQMGNDMMFNPTAQQLINTGTPTLYNLLLGGHHNIYVTRQKYDECAFIRDKLSGSNFQKVNAIDRIAWTAISILPTGEELLSYADGLIPNDVTIKLRVSSSYAVYVGTDVNQGYPTYQFKVDGLAPTDLVSDVEINEALDAINVVPNPYYGYSAYETSQFTTTVKITNLPPTSTITIYSLDGKFIRQYTRNEAPNPILDRGNPGILEEQFAPDVEWDLKNHRGIPIASGVYLVHIDAPGMGERVIKWFGVARQFDPSGL